MKINVVFAINKWIKIALTVFAVMAYGNAYAAMIVNIPVGTSWGSAITSGFITPSQSSDGFTQAALQFYTGQGVTPEAINAILTPDISVASVNNTMAMSWNGSNPNQNFLPVAWWNYFFGGVNRTPIDMSTGSSRIIFTLYPPVGVWDVSMELIDVNGRSRGWFFPMPTSPTWSEQTIFVNLGGQGVFSNFFNETGFDITKVVAIRFDEAGRNSNFIALDPNGNAIAWNAWDSLRVVVPEPDHLSLFVLGLAVLGYQTLQSKKKV